MNTAQHAAVVLPHFRSMYVLAKSLDGIYLGSHTIKTGPVVEAIGAELKELERLAEIPKEERYL